MPPSRASDATLIVRGRIHTMDPRRPVARAFAVRGDRIVAVGTEAQAERWRSRGTTEWRLPPGRTVVPGFVDAHAHLATDAWRRTWVDLGGCASLEDAFDRLRARVATARHGEWIVGRGWDESTWPVKRYLTRHDLDRVSATHPILVNRVDGHMCSVNTVAFRGSGLAAGVAGVELGPDRQPTGVLKEEAAERARAQMTPPTGDALANLLADAIAHVHSLGITSVHDIVHPRHVDAYERLRRQNRLGIRAYLMPYAEDLDAYVASGFRTGFGDEWLRLGAVKVFSDGSMGARTAALFDPYDDAPRESGGLVYSPKALTALLARAHGAGFQAAVHAIGDRAIDVVAESLGRVLEREPREDHRHRIEHFELPSEEVLDRVKELGLVASMQPNFVVRWSGPGEMYERRLGRRRLARNNPYREVLRKRIPLAFGSDGMPYGPLYGLGGPVDAPFPAQRISAVQALRSYTAGSAYAGFSEHEVGTLAAGKLADFVILTGDPTKAPLDSLAVDATVVGGRVVYRQSRRAS